MRGSLHTLVRASRRVAACLVVALVLTGCRSEKTADEVKRDYALKILEGFSVGFYDISAERADPDTYTLYNLTFKSGDTLIHADQADILVNPKNNTISLSLKGVVGADTEIGALISLDDLDSGAIRVTDAIKP